MKKCENESCVNVNIYVTCKGECCKKYGHVNGGWDKEDKEDKDDKDDSWDKEEKKDDCWEKKDCYDNDSCVTVNVYAECK